MARKDKDAPEASPEIPVEIDISNLVVPLPESLVDPGPIPSPAPPVATAQAPEEITVRLADPALVAVGKYRRGQDHTVPRAIGEKLLARGFIQVGG